MATPFGVAARGPSVGAVARYLAGIGGLAFCLTLVWLSMRAVLDIGGVCATGGPYVPRVPCPEEVVAVMPLAIIGLFVFGGLAWWGGAGLGGAWAGLILLAWPALFLSLGWNFLEYGLAPPGGEEGELAWGWLVSGVIFVVMGGGPLLLALWGVAEVASGGRSYAGGRVIVGSRRANVLGSAAARPGHEDSSGDEATSGHDLTARLERLARLRAAGALTEAEFEAAKRATLDEAGA